MMSETMLEIRHADKTFGKGTMNAHGALNDLSIRLNAGDFVTAQMAPESPLSSMPSAVPFILTGGKYILAVRI